MNVFKSSVASTSSCSYSGCDLPATARGLCPGHYGQEREGKPLTPLRTHKNRGKICSFEGCGRAYRCKGYCRQHYYMLKAGRPLVPIVDRPPQKETIKHRNRSSYLKLNYDLTPKEWQAMLEDQQGKCAICDVEFNEDVWDTKVNTDHDHSTGAVRQLLCTRCNLGLGYFQDNQDLMLAAVAYLEAHRALQPAAA